MPNAVRWKSSRLRWKHRRPQSPSRPPPTRPNSKRFARNLIPHEPHWPMNTSSGTFSVPKPWIPMRRNPNNLRPERRSWMPNAARWKSSRLRWKHRRPQSPSRPPPTRPNSKRFARNLIPHEPHWPMNTSSGTFSVPKPWIPMRRNPNNLRPERRSWMPNAARWKSSKLRWKHRRPQSPSRPPPTRPNSKRFARNLIPHEPHWPMNTSSGTFSVPKPWIPMRRNPNNLRPGRRSWMPNAARWKSSRPPGMPRRPVCSTRSMTVSLGWTPCRSISSRNKSRWRRSVVCGSRNAMMLQPTSRRRPGSLLTERPNLKCSTAPWRKNWPTWKARRPKPGVRWKLGPCNCRI